MLKPARATQSHNSECEFFVWLCFQKPSVKGTYMLRPARTTQNYSSKYEFVVWLFIQVGYLASSHVSAQTVVSHLCHCHHLQENEFISCFSCIAKEVPQVVPMVGSLTPVYR